IICMCIFFFFFQAEDGIRDFHVTGVQTCALPICSRYSEALRVPTGARPRTSFRIGGLRCLWLLSKGVSRWTRLKPGYRRRGIDRSEERRVGKECRSRWKQRGEER